MTGSARAGDSGPLRVGIGVLAGVTGGPASYGRQLVAALTALPQPPRVTVFTDRPEAFAASGCETVSVPMRGGLDRLRWQYLALPRALSKHTLDVYHDTKNALPRRLGPPGVVTVHDLAYHTVPDTFGRLSRLFLRRATRDAVRRAAVVIVPSRATADDLARIHPDCSERLAIVPHGIAPAAPIQSARAASLRAHLHLPERFVLHVGTIQSRKNVHLIVQAVRALRARHPDLRAVLVGRKGWLAEPTLAEISRDDTALWVGSLDDEELRATYAGATAFVSPSAYEGFGFTVADALAAGVPTVISDVSSLPEVCGDAALRLASIDATAIAECVERILADPTLAADLRSAGPRRAAAFTWQRSAAEHLVAYQRAAGRA